MQRTYDVAIVGGGPTGLSAAVNASSEGLDTLVLESQSVLGGQSKYSSRIENYLGFPEGLSGAELSERSRRQAEKFGTEFRTGATVTHVSRIEDSLVLTIGNDAVLARTLLVACGLQWRHLSAENVERFEGKGIEYGATPESASLYRGKRVVVIGGANSAGQAALNLSKYAAHVIMLVRGTSLEVSMSDYLIKRITVTRNITVRYKANVRSVQGSGGELSHLLLNDGDALPCDNAFVFIGSEPRTTWISDLCACDGQGYIVAPQFATNAPGIFAAGDVRHNSVKRIAAGVGEGSQAVSAIHNYLANVESHVSSANLT